MWGIGLAEDFANIENPLTWNGLNLLGFALMAVREELKI
nr:NADAR domain-containing protein [Xenorhabdus bovienii]